MNAAARRQILAAAHAAAHQSPAVLTDSAEIQIERALIETGLLAPDDAILAIDRDGTTLVIITESGSAIELDAYGNTLIGAAE